MSTREDTATTVTARRFPISAPTIGYGETFRALRHRDFPTFWIGQAVSTPAPGCSQIGQAWLVLQLTTRRSRSAAVTMFQALPVLLFGLFGGVIADRFPKRKLLLFTQTMMLLAGACRWDS